jgi:hypothetical protein
MYCKSLLTIKLAYSVIFKEVIYMQKISEKKVYEKPALEKVGFMIEKTHASADIPTSVATCHVVCTGFTCDWECH